MEEKGYWELNWTALFVVTACSCFVFSFIIKILDGSFSTLLLIFGSAASVMSILSCVIRYFVKEYNKKKSDSQFSAEAGTDYR